MVGITLEDFRQSRAYQEIFGLGEACGEARGEAKVILRLLARRCGPVSAATTARIQALPLEQLEALAEALGVHGTCGPGRLAGRLCLTEQPR